MSKHTKEPWKVEQSGKDMITDEYGTIITTGFESPFNDEICEANALRIVSCVNACSGLNPAAIPALVEAAELLVDFIPYDWPMPLGWNQVVNDLRAALKKLEEK